MDRLRRALRTPMSSRPIRICTFFAAAFAFLYWLVGSSHASISFSSQTPSRSRLLAPAVPHRRALNKPLYSTHNCVGLHTDRPLLDSMRCRFQNVCLQLKDPIPANANEGAHPKSRQKSSVQMTYHRPASAASAPHYWYGEFVDKAPWVMIDRDSPLSPDIVLSPIPSNSYWSPAHTTVLTEAFWPENFGHALGDDFLPVFRLAKSFGMYDRTDLQVIFHPDCSRRGGYDRGCEHHAEMSRLVWDRPSETEYTPLFRSGEPICFRNLLVGTREMGMGFPSENAWPQFITEIKQHVGVDTLAKPKKQKVSIFYKKGRRTILNYDELRDHLAKRFEIEVEVVDPARFDLEEQIQMMQDTTVAVSPCGGVSFTSVFMPPGASAIFLDYWNANWNSTGQMERHIYSFQSDITPFYFPLEWDDLFLDEDVIPEHILDRPYPLFRDYANVSVPLLRMEQYVLAGLIQAEVSFELSNSFKLDP